MSDRAMNFLKAGISGFIGICCLGDTQANWPYAAVLICAIVTVAYIKQALDVRR